MVKLEDWSVTAIGGPYTAPELWREALYGKVYGHPKFNNGDKVRTSPIKKVDGRMITTASGTVYKIGKISPIYRKWLRKNRPNWNWRKPIIML